MKITNLFFFVISFFIISCAVKTDMINDKSSAMDGSSSIYVDAKGNDQNKGSKNAPVATLRRAKDIARETAGKKTITIWVADGTYYLPHTLKFTAEDSGTADKPIVYKAVNEGQAIISGGKKLDVDWKPYKEGIYTASIPADLEINQLFINGTNQQMARYPNYDAEKKTAPYNGFAADAFAKERVATWNNPKGGYIHAMHSKRWGGYHYQILGKKKNGELNYEGGWQNNRQMGMHEKFRMVENIFEELDAPGEWFHNSDTNILYYYPPTDLDISNARVEIVRLSHLIEFEGAETNPVKYITLQGFNFKHAARTFMETKEPLMRSDWAIYRGGAVLLRGTENIKILDSEFGQLGGNAIFVNHYNKNTLVKGCHIHNLGASAVCFVGDSKALRNPLFEYHEKNDLTKIDLTKGPKTNNYPANGIVEDCLIYGIGLTERQTAGVQIQVAQNITVRDVSIYDCSRAGINIGDGAWGGHLIERCDVFNTVLETHDHGSFNSWGRDRYWSKDRPASQVVVDKNPNLPFLDAVETTIIRNSRWRCDHGWDIDLDDGSSNYDIYNNLMLNKGLKLREGFRRRAWNNIMVNGGLHPHVWYDKSQDEVYSNIFATKHKGARMPHDKAKGKRVDENLFFGNPKSKDLFIQFGWDVNSIHGDPMFVDPAVGDFRVKEGSPAFEIGFKNFPMDQFGVKKPRLKVIAKTPIIPTLKGESKQTRKVSYNWSGMQLAPLQGEEFSAYGISSEEGGLVVKKIPMNSAFHARGVKRGDILLTVNERPLLNKRSIEKIIKKPYAKDLRLVVVRNQTRISL